MSARLLDSFVDVTFSESVEDYRSKLVSFARDRGFDYASGVVVLDLPQGAYDFNSVDNIPTTYRDTAGSDPAAYRRDPVMQHCKRSPLPIVWDQGTYVQADAADLWETQSAFGFRSGIAVAMHMPNGRHFMFGVDGDRKLTAANVDFTALVADIQLFAVYANEGATRVFGEHAPQSLRTLSERELECLKWVVEGKTAWETGLILGIEERTVTKHLQGCMSKLGAVNKIQAASKALRLGIIR